MPRDASALSPSNTVSAVPSADSRLRENALSRATYNPKRTDSLLFFIARIICFATVIFVTWNIGGTKANTLYFLAPAIALAHLLVLLTGGSLRFRYQAMPVACFAMALAFLAWSAAQLLPIPESWLANLAPGTASVRAEFLQPALSDIQVSVSNLEPKDKFVPRTVAPISVIPYNTLKAFCLYSVAFAAFILAAIVFDSRKSRTTLLWVVAINAVAVAAWGLTQRASGSLELLPGYTLPQVRVPFGPFIYKNAGAAALMPGIAACIALAWMRVLPKSSGSKSSRDTGYSAMNVWTSTGSIALIIMLVMLVVGVTTAFSRGAWAAAVCGLATLTLLSTHRPFFRRIAVPFTLVCALAAIVITVTGLSDLLSVRATRLSIDSISTDQRWEHWKNGWHTAIKHLPAGSGAGTYGYAQNAEQTNDQNVWFREAHNHYIEVMTESGIIGIAIFVFGLAYLMRRSSKVFRLAASREWSSWGLVGVFLLIAIAVQSTVDFVIKIPGVLIVSAVMLGVVARVSSQFGDEVWRFKLRAKGLLPIDRRWARSASTLAPWCVLSLVFAGLTLNELYKESQNEPRLALTAISEIDFEPSEGEISQALSILEQAIATQPMRANLYQRRSLWHQLAFRRQVIESASRKNLTVPWQVTTPESILQVSQKLTPEGRESLLSDLIETQPLRSTLALALRDIALSLERNPLVPQVHIAGALLATPSSFDRGPWLARAIRLSRSNEKLQFATGLIAYYASDVPTALSQWQASLSTTMVDFEKIVSLAEQVATPLEITTKLIPNDRSEIMVPWLRRLVAANEAPDLLAQIVEKAKERIAADSTVASSEKPILVAKCLETVSQWEQANDQWSLAVRENASDPDVRYAYTTSLLRLGEYEEAIKQASLGSSLEPQESRFPAAAQKATQKRRERAAR